jgi:hypothetical protein
MYHRIIILALLFLCSEKSNSLDFHISPMEISDALPVQFWLTGCATFNEHHAPGVFHKCFCAPWECDDEIRIQFKDDPAQNYSLEIYDIEDQLLGSASIEETYVGVYEIILNLAEDSPDVCDQLIYFQIKRNQGLQGVTLPSFNSWQTTTDSPGDVDWTTGSNPTVSLPNANVDSEILWVDYAFIPGVEYTIIINYNAVGGAFSQTNVSIMDSSFNTLFQTGVDVIGGTGSHSTNPLTFTATSGTTKIGMLVSGSVLQSTVVTLQSATATRSVGDDSVVAKSDCLDIRENHDDTILLTYSNHRNFAGLVYQNTSPNTTFNIRIPAIFFHQRFPEEDEVMELSSELATLNGTLRKQRLLDTDYVPYYFHEKLKLILKHQSLSVFNREWVKQEAYQIAEGNRQAPLKKAQCWLSEKEFVHRNIL